MSHHAFRKRRRLSARSSSRAKRFWIFAWGYNVSQRPWAPVSTGTRIKESGGFRSEACTDQAFQVGETVLGLQFHLETTLGAVRDLIENGRKELI